MESKKPATVPVAPEVSLGEALWRECKALLWYALREGKALDEKQLTVLEGAKPDFTQSTNTGSLLAPYNYLLEVVKPTTPGTIVQMQEAEASSRFWRLLGPLPIVRHFMLVAILALLAMIGISLSPHVNTDTIQLSMLQGYGIDQVFRLGFLVACASVGASFYALFKMNNYLAKGTFDIRYSHTYWSRFVLGIVAGLLLSELFVSLVEPSATDTSSGVGGPLDSLAFLLKPVLAILGGFSANLVYRILNKLVTTVETLFKGEAEDMIAQREFQAQLHAQERQGKLQTQTANQLLALKQTLVSHEVPEEVLSQLDATLGTMVGTPAKG